MIYDAELYREALIEFISDRIDFTRRQRNDKSFGWNTLAKELGIKGAGRKFRLWKSGEQSIKIEDIIMISEYFNISPAMLVSTMETMCKTQRVELEKKIADRRATAKGSYSTRKTA